jgi:hypothetical protein
MTIHGRMRTSRLAVFLHVARSLIEEAAQSRLADSGQERVITVIVLRLAEMKLGWRGVGLKLIFRYARENGRF